MDLSPDPSYDPKYSWQTKLRMWIGKTVQTINKKLNELLNKNTTKVLFTVISAAIVIGLAAFAVLSIITGTWVVGIGAIIGLVVGFTGSIVSQGLSQRWGKMNLTQAMLDGVIGAISGALGASGISMFFQ